MAFACSSTLSNAFVGLNVALVVRAHIGKEFVNSYIRFNKPFSGLRYIVLKHICNRVTRFGDFFS